MEKAFIYARVSTQEQVNGYSISEQLERLEAYAKARGYTVVGKYVDPGYSGANTDRPALQDMIKNITNADIVIVYKLDRLSRSQRDTMHLIEDVFLSNNINFVSVSESFDTSTPFGRAMVGILSVFAQLEREQIAERSMMGKLARAKEGYYHGGGKSRIVTGYDYIDGHLIVNDYEAECIKYIFDRYTQGIGTGAIFEEITEKYPNVVLHSSTISSILKNTTYIGKVTYKKQEFDGKHQPIIDKETFDVVQELIKKRSVKSNNFKGNYLLSGLVWCGCCGARLHGRTGTKLKSGYKRYYSCYTRRGTAKHMMTADTCDKKNTPKEKLEESVVKEVKKLTLEIIDSKRSESNHDDKRIALENELNNIDRQLSKLVSLFAIDNMPFDVLQEKTEQLNNDKIKLKRHISEIEESKKDERDYGELISQLDIFDEMEFEQKKITLSNLIDKIIVTDDDVTIDWAFM